MRKIAAVLGLTVALGGCGLFHHTEPPAHTPPNTTAVWGNWILRHPDSTSFAGASTVELAMQPGTFTLTANYPGTAPVVITGRVDQSQNGLLTFVPQTGVGSTSSRWHAFHFVSGQPITVLAGAAGGSLVFAPSSRLADPTPSSVWSRMDAAEAAGFIGAKATSTDTTHHP